MNEKAKIERLKAIKEEVARVQARLKSINEAEKVAEATNLSTLLENDLEQAELILAAQDVMSRLQEMAEDIAKTSARDLFPLADRMKAAFGPAAAKAFEQSSTHALDQAMEAVRAAKDELGTAILRIEGKITGNDMGDDMAPATGDTDMSMDAGDATNPFDASGDEFGGADAASGPEEEPLGRARKESVESAKNPLREGRINYRVAGKIILEKVSMKKLMGWMLAEAAASLPAAQFSDFAQNLAVKAEEDVEATAGWIGKQRYGAAAMAHLSAPAMTSSPAMPTLPMSESEQLDELSPATKASYKGKARHQKWGAEYEGGNYHNGKRKNSGNYSADDNEVIRKRGKGLDMVDGVRESDAEDKETKLARLRREERGYNKIGQGNEAARLRREIAKLTGDDLDERRNFDDDDGEDRGRDGKRNNKERFKSRKEDRYKKYDDMEESNLNELSQGTIDVALVHGSKRARNHSPTYYSPNGGTYTDGPKNKKKDESRIAEVIAKAINHNLVTTGKGSAASVLEAFASHGNLVEGEDAVDSKSLAGIFEGVYGMKPAVFSVRLREFMASQDEKNAAGALSAFTTKLAADKNAANKPVTSAMSDMSSQERMAVNKVMQKMKKDGKDVKKVSDLVAGASEMAGDKMDENINAAHWPTSKFGQYAATPAAELVATKLKAPKSGGDDRKAVETSSEAPSESASEEPTGDASAKPAKPTKAPMAKEKTSTEKSTSENPVSKFAKKPKAEKPAEEPADDK